jgi:hypothetical protein
MLEEGVWICGAALLDTEDDDPDLKKLVTVDKVREMTGSLRFLRGAVLRPFPSLMAMEAPEGEA